MRRIIRTEAVCLRSVRQRESSKLVTLLSPDRGRVICVARGARRPKSRFGAALEPFAVANVIYYWHQQKTIYTLSDAQLVRSFAGLAQRPERFLAAGRLAEFLLRALSPEDPHPELYRLTTVYLEALEAAEDGFPALVSSFLLKAVSFLGFRPELRRCLACGRPVPDSDRWVLDPGRGGVFCRRCREAVSDGIPLEPAQLEELTRLLYTPVHDIARSLPGHDWLDAVLGHVLLHLDIPRLNSFGPGWPEEAAAGPKPRRA